MKISFSFLDFKKTKTVVMRLIILLILIVVFFVNGKGQFYDRTSKSGFSLLSEYSMFYKGPRTGDIWDLFAIQLVYRQKSINNFFHSYRIGYGKLILDKEYFGTYPITLFEYSYGLKIRKYFFEIGSGITITPAVSIHARLGYHYTIAKRIELHIAYTPTLWLETYYDEDESRHNISFHDLRIGIGYQFHDNFPRKVKQMIGSFQSLHLIINPISFTPDEEYRYTSSLEAEFLVWENYEHHISTNLGMGFLFTDFFYTKSVFFPMSINYLYGEENHFFEANLYHIYMTNSASYSPQTYRILQPQIGYRYQFNSPFFVRVAYAPYFRMADWRFRDGMEQSMVFGVGYRLHK